MSWLQLELILDVGNTGDVEECLLAAGAQSLTSSDAARHPLYEPDPLHPPVWPLTRLNALFPSTTEPDAVRAVLSAALGALPPHRFTVLEDRAWSREWLKDFKPMRFGRRLWVIPSTYAPPDPAAVNIRLDPGLAFGSGTHPTTALCLEWLEAADLAGQSVMDYGCGSGILAVAAARLGAQRVLAIDNDPQALHATHANAVRNRVSSLIRTMLPSDDFTDAADVLVANILAAPLCALAKRFAALVKPGGHVVLSGILEDQGDELRAAYSRDFRVTHVAQRQEWLRMDGRRLSGER